MKRLALSVLALFLLLPGARGQSAAEKKATIAYLRSLWQKDGGFAPSAGGKSSLRATVGALRAIHYFSPTSTPVPPGKSPPAFVASCFDKASGGFADRLGGKPDVASTAVGLMAVKELAMPLETYEGPAVRYLGKHAVEFEQIRIAAAALEAIKKEPAIVTPWLGIIALRRNADGTYGKGDGVARATGSAVAAVLRLGGTVERRPAVIKALKEGQRKDGGFGEQEAAGSDLGTTYRVMRAIHMLKAKPDVARCRAFIARCRNKDGGYGVAPGKPSGAGPTYYAAIVLHWLDEMK